MSRAFEVDWLAVERLPELQAFIDAEWARGHILVRDSELVRWQHRLDDHCVAVAVGREGRRLKGMLGVIPVDGHLDGRAARIAWLTMWVVSEDARPARLGLELLSFVADRFEAVGTLGANEQSLRIYDALGFRTCAAVPRWIRGLDPDACSVLAPGLRPGVGGLPPESAAAGFVRDWVQSDASAWDELWDRQIAPGLTGTRRDAKYLDWRYLSHPRFSYRIRVAERADAPVGLLVYRREVVRGTEIAVLRVLDALGDDDALVALFGDLVATGIGEGAAFADFSCTSRRHAGVLAANGFVTEDEIEVDVPSRFQPLEAASPMSFAFKAAAPLAGGDVYATRSDADQDRPN